MATGIGGSILDFLSGGESNTAEQQLSAALAAIQGVQAPTEQQLQLSPLAQYESTGNLTPAQAQAAQAGPNALNSENLSGVPLSTIQQALSQEAAIANSNGMTPQEQAAIAEAEQSVNENTAGQRGAIAQQFAGEGVPQSLISAALQNQTAGQEAQQGYQNALSGQASAANNALTALQNEGTLAGQEYSLQAGQANTVAAAQNALNQFNAANTQQTNLANQANQQAANTYDTQNAQNLANANVQGQQQVQVQNQVTAPQQSYEDAIQKAAAEGGVSENQASQSTAAGQQSTADLGALASGTGSVLGTAPEQGSLGAIALGHAEGGEIPEPTIPATNFRDGGSVPGMARVAGNSPQNDTVPARLSPGEVVLPRTVAQNPGPRGKNIASFLAQKVPNVAQKMGPSAHASDVASVLKALSVLRAGAA